MAARYHFSTEPAEYFRGFALPLLADGFAFLATVGAVALLVPHPSEVRVVPGWILVAAAYLAALGLRLGTSRLPLAFRPVLPLPATLAILGAVWVGGSGAAAVALASFFNLLAVGVFPVLSLRWTGGYIVLIGVGYAALLAAQHVEGWPALTAILVGELLAVIFISYVIVSRLKAVAMQDELTKLDNRRAWYVRVSEELARARRSSTNLTIALVDLDGFKAVNDDEGHEAGDRLLQGIAAAWSVVLRPGDGLARWGGDEFSLVLPGCDADQADEVLRRLATAMPEGRTFSAGVATWNGVEDFDALMRRADQALYAVKRDGPSQPR